MDFEERLLARTETAKGATWGDIGRSAVASVADLAGSVPSLAAYGATQFDGPMARDLEYISQGLADSLFELGDDIRGANTPAAQRIVAAKISDGEFLNHTFDYLALNAANTAAPIVAGVVGAIVSGPTVGMLINSGIAGAHSAGITYNDMVKDLDVVPLDTNKDYQSLIAGGMSPQEARREFKRAAIGSKPLALAVITALMARYSAGGQVVSKIGTNAAAGVATGEVRKGLVRRVAEGMGMSGGEEAAQNTLEEGLTQATRIDAGVQDGYDDQRLIEAALAGGVIGAALGAPAGLYPDRRPAALDIEEEDRRFADLTSRPSATAATAELAATTAEAPTPPTSGATTTRAAPPPRGKRTATAAPTTPAAASGMTTIDPALVAAAAAKAAPTTPAAPRPAAGAAGGPAPTPVAPAGGPAPTPVAPEAKAVPGAPSVAEVITPQRQTATSTPVADSAAASDLFQRAVNLVRSENKASTSFIQRKLGLGYNKAAALVDQLEKAGIITAATTSGKRDVIPEAAAAAPAVEEPIAEEPVAEEAAASVAEVPVTPESNQVDLTFAAEDPRVQAAMQKFLASYTIDPNDAADLQIVADQLVKARARAGVGAPAAAPIPVPEDAATAGPEVVATEEAPAPTRTRKKKAAAVAPELVVEEPVVEEPVVEEPKPKRKPRAQKAIDAGKKLEAKKEAKAPKEKPAKVPKLSAEAKAAHRRIAGAAREQEREKPTYVRRPRTIAPEKEKPVRTAAAQEKIDTGKRRKKRKEQPLPQAVAKPAERKAPEPGRTPAVIFRGQWHTGKSHAEARLAAAKWHDLDAVKDINDDELTKGFEVDGKFVPVREQTKPTMKSLAAQDETEAFERSIGHNIEGLKTADFVRRREHLETVVKQGDKPAREAAEKELAGLPQPKQGRNPNQLEDERRARKTSASKEIFDRHAHTIQDPTDLDLARRRIASIAEDARKVEKAEKPKYNNEFSFGRYATKKLGGAHGWLVRALMVDSKKTDASPREIRAWLANERLLQADPDSNPTREQSQAEAVPRGKQVAPGAITQEEEPAAPQLSDEDIEQALNDAAEVDEPVTFSPDFAREQNRPRYRAPTDQVKENIPKRARATGPATSVKLTRAEQRAANKLLKPKTITREPLSTAEREQIAGTSTAAPTAQELREATAEALRSPSPNTRRKAQIEAFNAKRRAARTAERKASVPVIDKTVAGASEANPKTVTVQGETVSVTHARGTKRIPGIALKAHYGEFPSTKGVDGMPLDVYVGQSPNSDTVFVIRQLKTKGRKRGRLDEHKVMLAFDSKEDAEAAYSGSMPPLMPYTTEVLTLEDFKAWKKSKRNTTTGTDLTPESNVQEQVEESQSQKKLRQQATGVWTVAPTPRRVLQRGAASDPKVEADIIADQIEGVAPENLRTDEQESAIKIAPKKLSAAEAQELRDKGPEKSGKLESPYIKGKRVFVDVKRSTNVRRLLNQIDFNAAANGVKGSKAAMVFLKQRLARAVGDIKVHVLSNDNLIQFVNEQAQYEQGDARRLAASETYGGVFVSVEGGEGYIVINEDLFDLDAQHIAQITLHEVVHAATLDAIDRSPKLAASLRTLMDEVIRHHGIQDPSKHYGFTNEAEFVAEAMTNPAFQERLLGTPLSPQVAQKLGIRNVLPNGWQAFLTFVSKALKLPGDNLNVLHAIIDINDRLMTSTETRGARRLGLQAAPRISPSAVARKAATDLRDAAMKEGRLDKGGQRVPKLLALADLAQLGRMADRFWKGVKVNPVRAVYRLLTDITQQTNLNLKAADALITRMVNAEKSLSEDVWGRFTKLLTDETNFNVYADRAIADQKHLGKDPAGRPTLKGVQALAKHAELAAEYEALIDKAPELAALRNDLHDFFRKRQRRMSFYLVHNMLVEGFRGEIAAKDITDDLVSRIIDKKMTDADKAMFKSNPDLLTRIVRAKELYNMAGPYIPLMRRGAWVVRAKIKVTPPAARLNGTLKPDTENVYEFKGDDARKRAMAYARAVAVEGDKAWITGITIDEKTGEAWEELPDGTSEKITLKDPDSARVFRVEVQDEHVEFFDDEVTADKVAQDLEDSDDIVPGSVEGVQHRRWSPGDRGIEFSASDVTLMMRALEGRQGYKDMNKAMQKELQLAAQEFGLQMLGSTRVHKRRIMRRNVGGASLDVTRGLIDYNQSTASYTARLEFAQEMNDAMREGEASIDKGHRAGAKGRRAIWTEVVKRVDNGNGFNPGNQWYSPTVQRLMSASFVARLASPMYTAMDLLQVSMVTTPVVAARHKVAPTVRAFSKAYKDIGAGAILVKGAKATYRKAVDPDTETETYVDDLLRSPGINGREKDMLKRLLNIRGGLEIAKLERLRKTHGSLATQGIAGADSVLARIEGVSRQMPSAAEAINRSVALLGSYRLEFAKNGGDHDAAMQYADDINNMTNFNYSEINNPRLFNHPLMKIPFQFKRFGHGMYQLLGQQIGRAIRNENPGDRAEALKSLAYIVATHTLMAGTLGLPTEIPKAIVMGLFAVGITGFNWQDFEDAERALAADLLGPDIGEMLTRGITRGLPFGLAFDMSARVGLSDLFLAGEPNTGNMDDWGNWLKDMVVGAPGGMILDFLEGTQDLVNGDFNHAGQKMVPVKAFKDLLRAYDTGTEGKKTKSGRPSMDPYTWTEAFIRFLGATPEREAESSALKSSFYSNQAYIRSQRGKLERRWAEGSPADRIRMQGELERFNRNKPLEAQLSRKKLNEYTRKRETEIGKMSSGVLPSRSDQYVLERAEGIYNVQP